MIALQLHTEGMLATVRWERDDARTLYKPSEGRRCLPRVNQPLLPGRRPARRANGGGTGKKSTGNINLALKNERQSVEVRRDAKVNGAVFTTGNGRADTRSHNRHDEDVCLH